MFLYERASFKSLSSPEHSLESFRTCRPLVQQQQLSKEEAAVNNSAASVQLRFETGITAAILKRLPKTSEDPLQCLRCGGGALQHRHLLGGGAQGGAT